MPDFASTTMSPSVASRSGPEREQRRRRVAPGVRDQRALGRMHFGQPVAPGARREAVPLLGQGLVGEPVDAAEIDHDRACGRLERGRLLVPEAEEDRLGAARARLEVRGEHRHRAVEPRVERVGGPAGERIRPERDQLELRMREHPVERLLAGVPGRTEDGHGRHDLRIMHIRWNLCRRNPVSCSRTAPSSRVSPSALPASRPARRASRRR